MHRVLRRQLKKAGLSAPEALPDAAHDEIREVIKKHGGSLTSMANPTTSLEELFLDIVEEGEKQSGPQQ